MTVFICISGKAGSGKDTAADIFATQFKQHGRSVLITHYADLLKFICQNYFGWNGQKDEFGRSLLQYVGTECVRGQDPDYWVDFIVNVVRMFPDKWDYVIIPDTRFPNEIERIADAGYPLWHVHIERDEFESKLTPDQQKHKSETSLNDTEPDFVIHNTTIAMLEKQLHGLCTSILTGNAGDINGVSLRDN